MTPGGDRAPDRVVQLEAETLSPAPDRLLSQPLQAGGTRLGLWPGPARDDHCPALQAPELERRRAPLGRHRRPAHDDASVHREGALLTIDGAVPHPEALPGGHVDPVAAQLHAQLMGPLTAHPVDHPVAREPNLVQRAPLPGQSTPPCPATPRTGSS